MTSRLRVGIVGLSARDGWAARSHLRALRALEGLELVGVCASSLDSTREAARRNDVQFAFDSAEQMARSGEIDLSVVAVKVPRHVELVEPFLEAGVPVLCEWPLAPTSTEAEELAARASGNGVRNFVGLQARSSPQLRFIADLIKSGAIGEVLSTSLLGSGGSWGASTSQRSAYLNEERNGATLLTIPFAHAVDALIAGLGSFREVTASLALGIPRVRVEGSEDVVTRTAPDQVMVHGILESGVAASIHYRGGSSMDMPLFWEINGTRGELCVRGDGGHLQLATLTIRGRLDGSTDLRQLDTPQHYEVESLSPDLGPAYAVGHAYERIRADLQSGSREVPDFEHALQVHRLLDSVRASHESGTRVTLSV